MNWSRFQSHGDDPRRKFEAFAGLLFERWCRREFGAAVPVNFVNGEGGDGGVEAYARLADDRIVGLQAKWFLAPMGATQFNQIKKSIITALAIRPMITHYCVVVPRDLTDVKKGKGGTATKSERDRWNGLVDQFSQTHPNLELVLWGDTALEGFLADLCSDGMQAYWFDRSVFLIDSLRMFFQKAKDSWLSQRYIPELHSMGQIEDDLFLRLGEVTARSQKEKFVGHCESLLNRSMSEIARLPQFPSFSQATDDPQDLVRKTIEELQAWKEIISDIRMQIITGVFRSDATSGTPSSDNYRLLSDILENDRNEPLSATKHVHKTLQLLHKRVFWEFELLYFQLLKMHSPVLFIGDPGTGKTHALAHSVEERLNRGLPAVLIRAADVDPRQTWGQILATHLDLPGWSESQIFDALEATAIRSDIARIASGEKGGCVLVEPTRFLVAMDGLDETPCFSQWCRRLQEIQTMIADRPRICFVFSIRTRNYETMGATLRTDRLDIHYLQGDGDVSPEILFPKYCLHYKVDYAPNALLRWYFQSPTSVRLFCEEFEARHVGVIDRGDLSLVRLVSRKIDRFENEIRERIGAGWPISLRPVRPALQAISKTIASASNPNEKSMLLNEVITLVRNSQATSDSLSDREAQSLLEGACDFGLLTMFRVPTENPLSAEEVRLAPANDVVMDYLLADALFPEVQSQIAQGQLPALPSFHRDHPNATTMLIVRLCLLNQLRFYESGLWKDVWDEDNRKQFQMVLLRLLPNDEALTYRDWIRAQIIESMPGRRMVVHNLVIPASRIEGHPFGPLFIHELLKPLTVAQRDLFWSGPNNLPSNCGGSWEGYGPGNGWKDLILHNDDPCWAAPLLLAWGATTVDNDERDHIRCELARWGASNLVELQALLDLTIESNDPQMVEDLLCSAYGAVCLSGNDLVIIDIALWMDAHILAPNGSHRTDNALIRHCARGIVERAIVMGFDVPKQLVKHVRKPMIDIAHLLPLDSQTIRNGNPKDHTEPLFMDLSWYVVPQSYKDFFEELFPSRKVKAEPQLTLHSVDQQILETALTGRLGRFSRRMLNEIAFALDEAKAIQIVHLRHTAELGEKLGQYFEAAHDIAARTSDPKEQNILLRKKAIEIDPDFDWDILYRQFKTIEREIRNLEKKVRYTKSSRAKLHPNAVALLARHADANGVVSLSPSQFGFGYIIARLYDFGWNEEQFEGQPNGEKPGEVLGADVAILRRHFPSSHGSQSQIMQFREKYTWIATHELIGYLADRLPIGSEDRREGFVTPPYSFAHVLREMPNPASRIRAGITQNNDKEGYEDENESSWLFYPNNLAPSVSLSALNQPEIALEWVEAAPLPELAPWILPPTNILPSFAKGKEWLTLQTFVAERNSESQGESVLWLSCLIVIDGDPSLIWRDAASGAIAWNEGWSDRHASVGNLIYYDPLEIIWAPWAEDNNETVTYTTLDKRGKPVKISLVTTWSRALWLDKGHEREFRLPAQWLRESLGVVDYREGQFLNSQGETVAFFQDSDELESETLSNCVLLVSRALFENAVRDRGGSPIWSLRIFREPSGFLFNGRPNDYPYCTRDLEWLSRIKGKGVEIILCDERMQRRPVCTRPGVGDTREKE